MNNEHTNATTIYEVRISSRERPEDSRLEARYETYEEAYAAGKELHDKGEPAFIRPVAS